MTIKKIISGGQTGADQAALDVAIKLGIPHGGWIMKNKIDVLNVAGPRASKDPKIYDAVSDVLESAMHLCSVENIPLRYKKPDIEFDTDIIDEILGEIPLREKSSIANMEKNQVETLQTVFDIYIRSKIGSDESEDDFRDIMIELWERLKGTHRIRSVK